MRRISSLAAPCAFALLALFRPATAANANESGASARQFSLYCTSAKKSLTDRFYIDVNLDTASYYTERRGLEQLGDVDDRKIIFRVHFVFEGVPGWREEEYLRNRRELYWSHPTDADMGPSTPDATCREDPPRRGFKATVRYRDAEPQQERPAS